MANKQTDYLAQWLSEFPQQRAFITHPKRVHWFRQHECPVRHDNELDIEWQKIVRQLRE